MIAKLQNISRRLVAIDWFVQWRVKKKEYPFIYISSYNLLRQNSHESEFVNIFT